VMKPPGVAGRGALKFGPTSQPLSTDNAAAPAKRRRLNRLTTTTLLKAPRQGACLNRTMRRPFARPAPLMSDTS
jgi:hypothetical protein